ncbi:pre-mrna-splicing factor cwc21 [Diaporthe amygdali]|uniref:pre-mrna-splicing factor cwc21 n=1 Tax=Phomopsis amygdali TaxID=1214568 RepID=UPI0022FF348A|nr:pre-mrna-splicing factor cwc21 [Diaporthe amygdali]KAJ0116322.1 pre-mrna-splicing factor cwc21 [Diaporthe amygdali]
MSDNVGLSTPRGSGTSGYVQRNLAHIRPRDSGAPYPPRGGDDMPRHRQRQPDRGILEHDRKRAVEVKVLELRDELEDEGALDDDEIEERCAALRSKLLAEGARGGGSGGGDNNKNGKKGALKMHQVHEMADQKIRESERLRRALKISRDYEEGGHWKRQEDRAAKAAERAEGERSEGTRDERD